MDAKKKKNRKKKGNQQNVTEDATSNSEKVVVQESNNGSGPQENHYANNSNNVDVQSVGVSESDMEHDKHKIHEENFANLREEARRLENERTSWHQKQVKLEEKIRILKEEVDLCLQKEAVLEEKLNRFQIENDKMIQKEAILEGELKNVESIQDSLIQTEILLKESIAGVEEASIALDMQVKELEGSRNTSCEENQRTIEKIVALELRIQSLEERATLHENFTEKMTKLPEDDMSVEKIEAARVDQTSERAELSRKVDQPYIVPENEGEHSSGTDLNHEEMLDRTSSPSHYVPESSEKKRESGEIAQSFTEPLEKLGANNGINDLVSEPVEPPGPPTPLDEPRISGTVPFDEIQIHEDDSRVTKNPEVAEAVPFSDAPLIGAPFRLISFVAKYVSGADLVYQNNSRSGH